MSNRPAVAARVHELIFSGYSNEEIAEIICREIPGAKTNATCVASYRYGLRKAGHDVMRSKRASKSKPAKVLVDDGLPAKSELPGRLHQWMQSWF